MRDFFPTSMNTNFILAIAPGKRELGVAVFCGFDLIYSAVKRIRHQESQEYLLEEVTVILKKLFWEFSISTVVLKAVSKYQKLSFVLDKVVKRIKSECRKKGLRTVAIKIEQIKSELCKTGKPTQKEAFKKLLASYPQLKYYWDRPNKWQNDYYAFLFSAVAVGTVYLNSFYEAA
jgi:hypothetical protein